MAWNSGKSLLLVTGASKGLGKAFAEALASKLQDGSAICLTARSESGLASTRASILEEAEASGKRQLTVVCVPEDMGLMEADSATDMVRRALGGRDVSEFGSAIIVHNAGTIGKCKAARDHRSLPELTDYFRTNLFSAVILNSAFLEAVADCPRVTVVNITSLAALQPYKSWTKYCSGKAAREMFFKTLAAEEKDRVRVLSYAPGPVDTDIVSDVVDDPDLDQEVKDFFIAGKKESTLLKPHMSAGKLVKVLDDDAFTSGDHVDYYDIN